MTPTRPQPSLLDDGYLVEPEPPERVPWQGWERPVVTHRRRDLFLAAIAIALLAAIVALLASGAWERAAATPSEAPQNWASPEGLRGAPHAVAWQVGAGIETRPLQRPGDSGLGRADVSAEARRERDLSRWQLVPKLPSTAGGGAPQSSGAVGSVLLGGKATWYEDPRKSGHYAAAGPVLREALGDWRGQWVTVESGSRSVTVQLTDWCACGERGGDPTLLDLSREAFAELADPSAGVITVSIEIDPPPHPDDERMRLEDRALPATSTDTVP